MCGFLWLLNKNVATNVNHFKGEGPLQPFKGGGGVHVHNFEAVVCLLYMQPLFGLYFQNPDFFFTCPGCPIFEKKIKKSQLDSF